MQDQRQRNTFILRQALVSAATIVGAVVLFAGCSKQLPATSTAAPTQSGTDVSPAPKVGNTTKTGKVENLSGKLYLQVTGQPPLEIDSYSVDLKSYVGKTVTITGEYSGNTLFAGSIK